VILRAIEETCVQFIALHSPRQSFDQLVIESAADRGGKGGIGVGGCLTVADMPNSDERMSKWREFSDRYGNARSEQDSQNPGVYS